MDIQQKLQLLADASRFDLACACGTKDEERRRRGGNGVWLHPVSLPSGGTSILLKTLLSNACVNDCRYCPLRAERDIPRCSLAPEEVARLFMDYVNHMGIHGIFLSSAVSRNADHTMDRMLAVAKILRKSYRYRGFVHLKIIPGASDEAVREAISLSSAVSLNMEAPTRNAFAALSRKKDFDRDIVRPIRLISELTAAGSPYSRVKQTTQFIVGASNETDSQIVGATFGLYKRLGLNRVYFSAYQRGLGAPSIPGERSILHGDDLLMREHRLYQVDWLIRKYGFKDDEIPFQTNGNLSLTADPKKIWADSHPERFPININRADKFELLRVPGLGPTAVARILEARRGGGRIHSLESLSLPARYLNTAQPYIKIA